MNVLFIAEDTSRFMHKLYHYLEQELAVNVNLMIHRKSGHIDYILSQLPVRPDFILLLNDIGSQMAPKMKGLAHTSIPTGLFVNDVHRFVKQRENFIVKNNINHLFTVVRDTFIQTYPTFSSKMEWFPHFVHTEIFRDFNIKKDINLLMMGAVSDVYPLRKHIIQAYKDDPNFIYHPHPGYRNFSQQEENELLIGENYAKELNRAKIVFTCPSIFHYPVIKYFEVLACNSLLLAPTFNELEDLGFIPGYHFVAIDENNFKEKAAYYLSHESERQTIATQGYRFIRQHHSLKQRTKELVHKMKRIRQERRF